MRKSKSRNPHTYFILIGLAIVILLIGIILILTASKIYEYPKYEKYSFDIDAFSGNDSPVDFRMLRTNYHFDTKKGTFSIIPKGNLSKLRISFPKPFIITSVEYHINHSNRPFYFEYENLNEKTVWIKFINKTDDEWIFINFDMELSPNAEFEFWRNSIWQGNSHFYFNMGDEFECVRQECFFNLFNAEIDRSSLGTQQEGSSSIKFTNQYSDPTNTKRHRFELSARSRSALTKKNVLLSLGVSLMAGAIFSLFSIIIAIVQFYDKN